MSVSVNDKKYSMLHIFNIGFIGGGNMSTAIVRGIFKNETHPPSKVWVSGPHIENLKQWNQFGANVTTLNGEVFDKCDIVFLGVKPSMLKMAVSDCIKTLPKGVTNKEVLIVSMLVGITLSELCEVLKDLSSKARIIKIMPNTPMTVGAGCCVYTPGPNVTDADCQLVEKLLSSSSICHKIPESQMDAFGALIASGPAFMYIVIEALSDAAVKQGIPRQAATKFASQMVVGSAQMVLQSGKHPGQLKDEVCSPGGTTICGVAALEDGGIRSTIIKAIQATTLRSKELGSQAPGKPPCSLPFPEFK